MKVAVVGASGFIGTHLTDLLLQRTPHDIVAIARHLDSLAEHERLNKIPVDIFDEQAMTKALEGCEVAYFLVHMMAQKEEDYSLAEARAAETFASVTESAGVKKIIYLGGLGNDKDRLSKHLKSRHKTGQILREHHSCVIEFRASMIVGEGSISFDIIANLVHKLPVLTLPAWSRTETQPIGLSDMLEYLLAALELPGNKHEIIEVGGPDVHTYEEIMKIYSNNHGYRQLFVYFPIIPVSIASWWLNLFTPKRHAKVGRAMVESLANPMVVSDSRAKVLFPHIKPRPIEEFF